MNEKLLLRPMEAAERLGLSRSSIYLMIAEGTLPGIVRIGTSVRISAKALSEWVDEQARDGISREAEAHDR